MQVIDVVDKKTRSRMMSGIQGKNTRPEIVIRQNLHRLGLRFRLHEKSLPGKPDIVLPKYKAVILVNGCFWHGHNCKLFKWPSTRKGFWREKITATKKRDEVNIANLIELGWRVLIVWECSLKNKTEVEHLKIAKSCQRWIFSGDGFATIP